ncbi:HDGF like 3 [Rhinolophus ferrumequinum]|uniref:HDGF like 3 n=1 Tax=Rhinolophus ferrumequinum TaxID=59479 RepID=A0A7J7RAV7_RHIFE|nr:HDGF like 3 [Rhinolophus ferrumequinum]
MEKAKGRMKKPAQNGKSHTLQRNPPNSPGNLQEMKTTRIAKKRKTKAALRAETPAMTQETPLQTCRKPVKGLNYCTECCILRETARRLCVWLSNILGFDMNQHGPCCH